MKHLVLLALLLATPAAAETSQLADPTPATPEATATEALPDVTSTHFPRPVYGPTCVEFVPLNGHVLCPRAITFYNDAPPSLVLGSL